MFALGKFTKDICDDIWTWEHSNEQGHKVEVSLEFTWSQSHIES